MYTRNKENTVLPAFVVLPHVLKDSPFPFPPDQNNVIKALPFQGRAEGCGLLFLEVWRVSMSVVPESVSKSK